ncbi:5822_t:CDS:1, partial [Acaulospora colombiana]
DDGTGVIMRFSIYDNYMKNSQLLKQVILENYTESDNLSNELLSNSQSDLISLVKSLNLDYSKIIMPK